MTRLDLIAALRRVYGEDSTGTFDDTDLAEWLNAGYRELVADTGGLIATDDLTSTAGTATVTLPSDFARARKVYFDGLELLPIDPREIPQSPAVEASPNSYAVRMYPLSMILYPTPDAAKTVHLVYEKTPASLDADADTPAIPEAYQRAIIYYAAAQWAFADDNLPRAQAFEAMYQARKTRFESEGLSQSSEVYPSARYVPHE